MAWLPPGDGPAAPTRAPQHRVVRSPRPAKKRDARKAPPSTIVTLRLPLELLARLDRYIDRLESHTGLKAHRGMIARRALELFLETHEASSNRLGRTCFPHVSCV